MSTLVYLDNHATTPVDPRVLEAMLPYFGERFGNAASRTHRFGWEAEEAVEAARAEIAALINATPRDVVFTSGATESDNLAIKGVVEFHAHRGDHIITGATEHKAVLDSCHALEKAGRARLTVLPVDRSGQVDPDEVRRALTPRTILISLMHGNNEIGTLHPIAAIGRIAKEAGVLFHCDAAQSVGKVPVDVEALGIDLLAMTAHKLYGPKGAGALWVRGKAPRVRLTAQMHGGGHERGMRSGTLNVPGIVGFGRACALAAEEMAAEAVRVTELRERLHQGLASRLEGLTLNGHPTERLPGNLNLSIAGIEGDSLMAALPDVAVSSGSACTSATLEPSPVLRAIGLDDEAAHASIRFGVGRFTTEAEIDYAAGRVVQEVERLRALSPTWAMRRRAAS
ncbi:MAG TPA: IscS subfamily cysteine desulfurase [Candidatus Dormibacteraeota bacterium]|nr:IscS subfamily cysteine desulfurase [Candidatus Dormibacteraeota bacterium]